MTISLMCKKTYTLMNGHMPVNGENRSNPDTVNKACETLENTILKVPQNHIKW